MREESRENATESGAEVEIDGAFVLALSEVQPILRGYLGNLLPIRSDVDDVLQETNFVLWKKRGEYDPERPFRRWACRFAYYQALDHLKRGQRRKSHPFSEALIEQIAARSSERLEDSRSDKVEALETCLEKLPEDQRRFVDLRYSRGESVQDLAKTSGKSPDAMSMLLYRARKHLGDCITQTLAARGGASG